MSYFLLVAQLTPLVVAFDFLMTANKELGILHLLQINYLGSDHGKFEKWNNNNRGPKVLLHTLTF